MDIAQVIGLASGFLLAVAISIRLEAYCVRLAAAIAGTQVSDRSSLLVSATKIIYGLAVGWGTGFFLAREEWILGGFVAAGGAILTPVLYKRFMHPEATWPQAVVVSLLVPVGYTLITLTLIGGLIWGMAVVTRVVQ